MVIHPTLPLIIHHLLDKNIVSGFRFTMLLSYRTYLPIYSRYPSVQVFCRIYEYRPKIWLEYPSSIFHSVITNHVYEEVRNKVRTLT